MEAVDVEGDPGDPKVCGIIMPISDVEPYRGGHWREVLSIVEDAVNQAGLQARLVSEADAATIIQKTIIKNVYFDEIVVCDVSARNPNVMIELGMRLAFNKPVVAIKDEITAYPFDTSALEYVPYTSDLRFQSVVDFKGRLARKIKATLKAVEEEKYQTFMDAFGPFEYADLRKVEVSGQELILSEIKKLSNRVSAISAQSNFLQFAEAFAHKVRLSFVIPKHISDSRRHHILTEATATFDRAGARISIDHDPNGDVFAFAGDYDEATQAAIQNFMNRRLA